MLRRLALLLVVMMGSFAISLAVTTPVLAAVPPGCHVEFDDKHTPHVVCESGDTQPGSTTPPTSGPGASENSGSDPGSAAGGVSGASGDGSTSGEAVGFTGYPTDTGVSCASQPVVKAAANPGTVQGVRAATSVSMYCDSDINGSPGFYYWTTPAVAAAAPPPVDLAALSRKARAEIQIPQFALKFGPDSKRLAVNMQTSFTAVPDRSMNLSATALDRGITVTVSGRLSGMAWSPGEPVQCTAGNRTEPCSGGQVGAVDCGGTSCQYTYQWVSSAARTGGVSAWTVTAVASWQFTYTTAGAGATAGPATATWTEPMPAGTGTASIGEWNTVGGFAN